MDGQVQGQTHIDSAVGESTGQATVLQSLEEMIKSGATSIAQTKDEKRKVTEMIADGYDNDATYREHKERVKEAQKILAVTKSQIDKMPGTAQLLQKKKDIALSLKERQIAMSDYLQEYERMTGATQLELFDGSVLDIVKVAKLVKRGR